MTARFRSDALPELFDVMKKYVQPGKNYIMHLCQEVTLNQKKYYHAVIVPLFGEATGYSKKKAKRMLEEGFLTVEKEGGGTRVRSITELSTIEMETFIEECRMMMYHKFGTRPPEPNYHDQELIIELEKVFNY